MNELTKHERQFASSCLRRLSIKKDVEMIQLLYEGYSAQCSMESAADECACSASTLDEVQNTVHGLNEKLYADNDAKFEAVEKAFRQYMNANTDEYM